ncbi:MAG: HlyD family efflux transporter periplasmic adaptor subunit [Planctomycetota bacterium]
MADAPRTQPADVPLPNRPPKPTRVALVLRLVVGLVVLGLAGVAVARLVMTKPTASVSNDPLANTPQVDVVAPRIVPVPRQVRGYGVAEAVLSADVPARISAVVSKLDPPVQEGQAVSPTTVLVKLDDKDFINELALAAQALIATQARIDELTAEESNLRERLDIEQEDLGVAERELTRMREFNQNQAGSQQDLDQAERNLLSARRTRLQTQEQLVRVPARRAALEAELQRETTAQTIAQDNLDRAAITSPIAGVLQSLDVEEGENVQVGERVARVVQLGRIEAPIRVPSSARSLIEPGDAVALRSTADGRTWDAVVDRVLPEDDPDTRTFVVYAELDQTQAIDRGAPLLTPGTFLEATITAGRAQPQAVVPRRSIQIGQVLLVNTLDTSPDVADRLPDGAVLAQVRVTPAEVAYHYTGPLPTYGLPGETQWAVLARPLPASDGLILSASIKVLDGATVVARSQDPVDTEPPDGG